VKKPDAASGNVLANIRRARRGYAIAGITANVQRNLAFAPIVQAAL